MSLMELSGSVSRLIMDRSSIDYGYWDGEGDAERTLKMVETGVIGSEIAMAEESGIWSKPNSDNFTQCIELPRNHKRLDANINGYILINANGGLNQMRFGVWQH
ncbi:O-fucosyltransferase 35 [Arachis hypogaea]|uniref:O-fucosyltransferase 35 n=1 Tax=Arachis hypogaea TaxID=3818 RepID=UPI000DECC70C|nr:O-fucosyltransferase 35 [Arachis hypogaea]